MKAIVHIGTEKTGTKSIQEYLYNNQEKLKKAGFYFIQSVGIKNHRALPFYCMNDDKYDDFTKSKGIQSPKKRNEFKKDVLKRFEEEIKSTGSNIHTVIISSEHFHSRTNTQEEVDRVYKFFRTYFSETKIICYVREQVKTCISLYSTAIKCGQIVSFEEFVQECSPENIYYNYYEMLMNWKRAFGAKSLDISLFDPQYFVNKDLLDDFTSKIDFNLIGVLSKDISVQNESLTYAGQILGKAINKAFPKYAAETGINQIREKCQEVIYKQCKGKGEQPDVETQNQIFNKFVETNKKLQKEFFPDKQLLFQPPSYQKQVNKDIDDRFVDILYDVFNVIKENSQK